jgi:lipid II:glycine glycyltransferase (peptidoglycan interpeptide bridge formation enzyme)
MVFTDRVRTIEDRLHVLGPEEEKKFLEDSIEYLKKKKICDFIAKSQANVVFASRPDGAECVPWGTYEIDLGPDAEAILASFDGKHRNVVRKALKDGARITTTDDVDLIYANIKETLKRQNSIHFPSVGYLQKLQKNLFENVRFYLALDAQGGLQGTALIVFDQERAYYMYGGSVEHPQAGSLNLLQYHVMLDMKAQGVGTYDLVGARLRVEPGSKFEGIQRFKSRFGATLRSGWAFRVIFDRMKFQAFNAITKTYLGIRGYSYEDPIDQIKATE